MNRFSLLRILSLALSTMAASSVLYAAEPCIDPLHRAGHPECVNRWAMPSDNCHYGGYYVGGGLPVLGESRCVQHEGTWGWDYFGILFTKKVDLNWGHGTRQQNGTYATSRTHRSPGWHKKK